MRCKKHKRYEGRIRPKCCCLDCWIIYIENHLDIDIINDAIEYMREMHNCWSFEYPNNDEIDVYNYLLQKRNDLGYD